MTLAVAIGVWAVLLAGHPVDAIPSLTSAATITYGPSQEDAVPIPEPSARALRYYRSGMRLWAVRTAAMAAVPLILLVTGASVRIRQWSHDVIGGWAFGTKRQRALAVTWRLSDLLYATVYLTITALVLLPLEWYGGFVRQHAYGLSNQTLGRWLSQTMLTFVLMLPFFALIVASVYYGLRAAPRRWWLYTGAVAIPAIVALRVVFPIWIAPLYNDFGTMRDQALEQEIVELANRAGIEGSRVFEVRKSQDTERVNAYVSGFGTTKRIVLWDTLVDKLGPSQVLFVMGHEMAHYVLGHLWKGLFLTGVLIVGGLYFVHHASTVFITHFKSSLGIDRMSDVASLPLLIVMSGVVGFVAGPAELAMSRYMEQEADRFALEITKDNYAAATTWIELQNQNLSNPRPGSIYRIWRATHPPLAKRIAFANTYRPWSAGDPLKYGDRFVP